VGGGWGDGCVAMTGHSRTSIQYIYRTSTKFYEQYLTSIVPIYIVPDKHSILYSIYIVPDKH
jgi:hypothetical protein